MHSAHPHVLHLLSSIRDTFEEVSPESPSLDLAAAVMVKSHIEQRISTLSVIQNMHASHRSALASARQALSDAELALDAAHESHTHALAAFLHTVEQAERNPTVAVQSDAARLLVGGVALDSEG